MLFNGCGAPRYRTVTSNRAPASITVATVMVSLRARWLTFCARTPSTVTRSTVSPSKSRLNRSSRCDALPFTVVVARSWLVDTR